MSTTGLGSSRTLPSVITVVVVLWRVCSKARLVCYSLARTCAQRRVRRVTKWRSLEFNKLDTRSPFLASYLDFLCLHTIVHLKTAEMEENEQRFTKLVTCKCDRKQVCVCV